MAITTEIIGRFGGGVFLYSLSTLWVWAEGVIKTSGLLPWCCFAGMGISRLGFPNRLCW